MSDNQAVVQVENEWHALNLELIAFTQDPAYAIEQNWVADLTGQECESLKKKGERVDTGDYRGARLRMAIDLLRIRFTVGALLEVNATEGFTGRPDIGPFSETLNWFRPMMDRWLTEMRPPIVRLAFVGKVVKWTKDKESSYRLLAELLPSVRLDPNCTDFQYRLNRPRTSAHIHGMVMNRLCAWSAIKMTMGVVVSSSGMEHTISDNLHGAHLAMDLNTSQEHQGPLPMETLPKLWTELTDYAVEIARRGDIP